MFKSFCVFLTTSFFLLSCQKEPSDMTRQTTDSSFAGMLRKKTTDNLSGSKFHIEHEYFYDSERRLARVEINSEIEDQGQISSRITNWIVYRDNLGRTYRIADSLSDDFLISEYEGNSNRLKKTASGNGLHYNEYFYGVNNQYERINHYSRDSSTANVFVMFAYSTYTYDNRGNNIKIEYYYDHNGVGTYLLDTKVDYLYDDKINPESLICEEGFGGSFGLLASPNNVLKEYVEWTMQFITHDTLSYNYTYDNQSRPVSHIRTGNIETKYYYY